MATATRPPRRGRNQNQPPAPAAPANPPAAPAAPAPAPRPVTPATVVNDALAQFRASADVAHSMGATLLGDTVARDTANHEALVLAERRRQSFWRVVHWVLGIIILLGVVALTTWAVMTVTADESEQPTGIMTPPADRPPAPLATAASAIGSINVFCPAGEICTAEECLWRNGGGNTDEAEARGCCSAISDAGHKKRCLNILECLLKHRGEKAQRDACVATAG